MTTRRLRTVLATGIAALLAPHTFAATYSYTGPGAGTTTTPTTGNLGDATAWSGDVLPTFDSTADLSFNYTAGSGAVTVTNNLGVVALNSLSVLNNKAQITLTGGTLNFLADSGTSELPTLISAPGSTQILAINSAITLGANLTMTNNGTGQIQIGNVGTANAGNIDLGANTLTLLNSGSASAYQFGTGSGSNRGVISGTGGMVQTLSNATSTAAFFGASTFSGGYTLNSGVLVIGVNSTGTVGAVTDGFIGTGTLTINGGTLRSTANGTRSFLNSVTVANNFALGDATATGVLVGGNVTLTGNRTITVTGGGTAADFTDRHTISGVIGDSGGGFSFTKAGGGTLVLSGLNTYTGNTAVTNGALVIGTNAPSGAAGALGNATSAISLGGSGTVAANLISLFVGVPGATPGAATITVGRDITVGSLNSGSDTVIGTVTDTDAIFSGNLALSRNILLSSLSTGSRAASFSGVLSGGFGVTKTNAGQVRLSGANTYTGATTIRRGSLLVAGDALVSTVGALGNANSAIGLADATSAATDNVTLAIDGAFTIGRGITINANNATGLSTLTALNAASTTATYGGSITLAKNAVLANGTANATTLFSGSITDGAGTFGITINGPGIVEFGGSGVHAYDGTTTVASGTLKLNRNFGGNNTITGPLTVSGGTVLLAGNEQLPDSLVLNLSGGVFDAANFDETIFDLNYTGGTILNGGHLHITGSQDKFLFDNTDVTAPENVNRHILYLGSTTAATVNAPLALDNDASHDLSTNDGAAAYDVIFNAALTNDGLNTPTSLIKKGLGTVRFNAANSFGGAGQTLELQGGTVEVSTDSQLGHSANTVTLNGGTLRIATAFSTARTFVIGATAGSLEITSGQSQTIGSLSGSGLFNKTGAGELVITGDQSASFSGSAAVNGGVLTISALNNLLGNAANDLTLNGGTLKVTGSFALDAGKTITLGASGGTLQIEPSQTLDLAVAGNLAGGGILTKTGAGKLIIGDANAGLTAGAGLTVNIGGVELKNAQSLGNTVKAALTLSGGTLTLTNDTATAFGNPVTVAANTAMASNVATVGGPGVNHTLGTLSLGAFTLQVGAGANVTGGAPAITFGGSTLTGAATLGAEAGTQLSTGALALGTNKLTITGDGTVNLSGAITGGPGAGLVALEKNGTGVATTSATAGTFLGNVAVNSGTLRVLGGTALGNAANLIRINGGALQQAGTAASYAVEFNGGTMQSTGANRDWNGVTSATPSVTFLTDTIFNLDDPNAPGTARDLNFGLDTGNSGVPASVGAVNLVVNAPASNATSNNKLRFRQSAVAGSVTGTVTVNPNAILQLRGVGSVNGFGSGAEIRLNTGFNATTALTTGRFEYVSNVDTNFGNHFVVLADSAIGVGRITTGAANNAKTMTAGNLSIGSQTLATIDVSGDSNDKLAFGGVTKLSGSPTFFTQAADLVLNGIEETGGAQNVTKTGTKILTLNGPGIWTGTTTVSAGTLQLGGNSVLGTAGLTVSGILASGATTQTLGNVSITGAGTWTSAAGGQVQTTGVNYSSSANSTVNAVLSGTGGLVKSGAGTLILNAANTFAGDINVNGGLLNQGMDNVLPDAAQVNVSGGTLNFFNGANIGRNETIGGLTMTSGLIRTANGAITTPTLVTITGTLDVSGGDLAVNSGSSLSAHKVVLSNVINTHVVGGNTASQVNELIIGAGGIEFTGSNMRMNLGTGSALGSRVRLNGDVRSFAAASDSGFYGSSTADTIGTREIVLGSGAHTFTVADGDAFNDLRVDFPLVGDGSLVKAGAGRLSLAAVNTFAGDTFINEGLLALSTAARLASPVIEVGTAGTFDTQNHFGGYHLAAARTLRVNGLLSGSVNVSGTLSGNGNISNNVTVDAGGVVSPGAGLGTLSVDGSITFNDDSALAITLGGSHPGDGAGFYDQLQMNDSFGSVSMGNNVSLSLSLSGGFSPAPSDIFYIFTRADFSEFGVPIFADAGEGDTVNLGNGYTGKITYLADWIGAQEGSTLTGGNDVAIYAVVPEPGAVSLLLGGLAIMAGRRRRQPRA